MHGIDIETTALDPADGEIRLVQISDGSKEPYVYDLQHVSKGYVVGRLGGHGR
jgi:hypothetical protein